MLKRDVYKKEKLVSSRNATNEDLFNLFYINTSKVHEIAMLIDNKIMKTVEREQISEELLRTTSTFSAKTSALSGEASAEKVDNAEDLTQETFIRFFTKLSDYHYKGKTLNYLYTIAGNLCKDYLKRTKETLLEENEFEEENQTEQILNRVLIEQILEQLPDDSREVLTLYYFQELKLTEISDTLQIGLPLVKYRLQKARKQLRELLGKEELDE